MALVVMFYSILKTLKEQTQKAEIPKQQRKRKAIRNKQINITVSPPIYPVQRKILKIQERIVEKEGQIENRKERPKGKNSNM